MTSPAPSVEGSWLLPPMSGRVTVWLPVTLTWTGSFGFAGRTRGKKRCTSARNDQVAFDPPLPVAPPALQHGELPVGLSSTAILLMSLPLNFAPWSTEGSGVPLLEMVCQ